MSAATHNGGTTQRRRNAAPRPANVAIVLGAGQGSRMGSQRNKVLLPLGDRPLLLYALAAFERAGPIDEILLVAHAREVETCRELASEYDISKVRAVIAGGASRHQSEWRALTFLRERILAGGIGIVLIHDGARPFVTTREIARLTVAARAVGGAVLATPLAASEAVVEADERQQVTRVLPTGELWRAQTPQAFEARMLLGAYELAERDGFEGTDTAASVERSGHAVCIVAGSARNFKVTTPRDLARAEALLPR